MDWSATIDRFLAGWSHDLPTLMTLFSDDVAYRDEPLKAQMNGKDELKDFASSFFSAFPDVEFAANSPAIQSADRAAVVWRATGTHDGKLLDVDPSGKTIDVAGVSVMEFKDGKIVRNVDYWDLATLLRQIGQLPG
ncbi:ester cyclase [Caballeronia insecticola]|nr:ester cyclase [Caballeronia insecticola]